MAWSACASCAAWAPAEPALRSASNAINQCRLVVRVITLPLESTRWRWAYIPIPSPGPEQLHCRSSNLSPRINARRGCSSMVELQLPKLLTWVRFPSPAPWLNWKMPEPTHGTLVSWKRDKAYGFIRPADGGKDVFVHLRDFGNIARTPI